MKQAIAAAVRRLSVIPFFPADEDARLEIMRVLDAMIGVGELYGSSPQQRLDWLVNAAVNAMRHWGGIPELRVIYSSKWKPADGIETYSSLPGYSAEDSESRAIDESRTLKSIKAGRIDPRLLAPAENDRMPEAELEEFHRETVGELVESTMFPSQKPARQKSLAEAERDLAEAPRHQLTEGEKARRLAELQARLQDEP